MNIAKILKHCPKGTKLYSLLEGDVTLMGVDDSESYPIKTCKGNTTFNLFTKDGLYFKHKPDGECLLFPSKEQRDWNKFRLPIKNGDIMMLPDGTCPFIATGTTTVINDVETVKYHCGLDTEGILIISDGGGGWTSSFYIPATKKVKTKLFDAMKKNGISFDGEKLIEKTEVKSKSEKHKFKPFEKILVKDNDEDTWVCAFFSHMEKIGSKECYECCSGILWDQAIPYEGNESLVGTISDQDQNSLIQCLI